jgi:hypothetical protein
MHPPGTPSYTKTYEWRNGAESSRSQLHWLYRGHKGTPTVKRQALVMVSFAVTHSAVADRHHRQRERTQPLAPVA